MNLLTILIVPLLALMFVMFSQLVKNVFGEKVKPQKLNYNNCEMCGCLNTSRKVCFTCKRDMLDHELRENKNRYS